MYKSVHGSGARVDVQTVSTMETWRPVDPINTRCTLHRLRKGYVRLRQFCRHAPSNEVYTSQGSLCIIGRTSLEDDIGSITTFCPPCDQTSDFSR
ncbi:hypothetical protein Ac2012v2_001004 [Leucoagaricus gongylophorus]